MKNFIKVVVTILILVLISLLVLTIDVLSVEKYNIHITRMLLLIFIGWKGEDLHKYLFK